MATPTTASPPVTASILMALWVIMTFEVSSVGSFAAVIRPFRAARLHDRLIEQLHSLLRGALCCRMGLYTTALPAEIMLMELLMMVAVGFVDGVMMAPITP